MDTFNCIAFAICDGGKRGYAQQLTTDSSLLQRGVYFWRVLAGEMGISRQNGLSRSANARRWAWWGNFGTSVDAFLRGHLIWLRVSVSRAPCSRLPHWPSASK